MTQYDKIRVGKGSEKQYLKYGDIVPLAQLSDIVFGCWDVYPQNAYQSAVYAEVLKREDIEPVRDELEQIVPMKAAFDKNYAKRLDGDNVKDAKTRWEMVELLREDIRRFKQEKACDRIVVLWAASTEIYVPINEDIFYKLETLEKAMKEDDREHIAPSMCYAYAALTEGCPFIMGAIPTYRTRNVQHQFGNVHQQGRNEVANVFCWLIVTCVKGVHLLTCSAISGVEVV